MGILSKSRKFNKGDAVLYKKEEFIQIPCIVLGPSQDGTKGYQLEGNKKGYKWKFYVPEGKVKNLKKISKGTYNKLTSTNPQSEPEPQPEPQPYQPSNEAENKDPGFFSGALNKLKNVKMPKLPKRSQTERKEKRERVPTKGSGFLLFLAIIVHLIDALRFEFSRSIQVLDVRILLYFLLVMATHLLVNRENGINDTFQRYGKVALIPVLGIPILMELLKLVSDTGLINISEDTIRNISFILLFVPIYVLYLVYFAGIDYEGKKGKMFMYKLTNWYFGILMFIGLLWLLLFVISAASTGSGYLGEEENVFSARSALQGGGDIISSAFEGVKNAITKVFRPFRQNVTQMYNETLGSYYRGQVEENKEITGVFIRDFRSIGTYYEDNPVELVAQIQLRSFVDEVNLTTRCHAVEQRNQSNIIRGNTSPSEINNVFRNNYISVRCIFDRLPEGRYEVHFVTDFNFETWVYFTLTVMEREFLISLLSDQVNVHREFDILPRTRSIFTNGPVMLGMNDGMEMPVAISYNQNTMIPVGITIDDRHQAGVARGNIRSVESFQIRTPKQFDILRENCVIPSAGELTTEQDDIEGYNVHTFDLTFRPGVYTTVGCTAIITPESARQLLANPTSKQEITIAGSTTYNYTLSRRENIQVRRFV